MLSRLTGRGPVTNPRGRIGASSIIGLITIIRGSGVRMPSGARHPLELGSECIQDRESGYRINWVTYNWITEAVSLIHVCIHICAMINLHVNVPVVFLPRHDAKAHSLIVLSHPGLDNSNSKDIHMYNYGMLYGNRCQAATTSIKWSPLAPHPSLDAGCQVCSQPRQWTTKGEHWKTRSPSLTIELAEDNSFKIRWTRFVA